MNTNKRNIKINTLKKRNGLNLKIGIDIDNVISNSHPAYIEKFNRNFGLDIKIEQASDFYYFWQGEKVDEIQAEKFIEFLLADHRFQLSFEPIDFAQEIVFKWSKSGHLIHYITARPYFMKQTTVDWLKKHGFMVNGATVDLFREGVYESGAEYKKDIVEKLGVDLLIEDARQIVEVMEIPAILIDKPWNQGKLPQNVIRVKSWAEIKKIVARKLI